MTSNMCFCQNCEKIIKTEILAHYDANVKDKELFEKALNAENYYESIFIKTMKAKMTERFLLIGHLKSILSKYECKTK